jgi:hypothetical protein
MECVLWRIFADSAMPGVTPRERRAINESLVDCQGRLEVS